MAKLHQVTSLKKFFSQADFSFPAATRNVSWLQVAGASWS
jgi:hypothetical protein